MAEIKRRQRMAKKKTGRTADEVSRWLQKQKWIKEFVRTMRDTHTSRREATRILAGEYGATTIAAGFGWDDSPQGLRYWQGIHQEFIKWYYEE